MCNTKVCLLITSIFLALSFFWTDTLIEILQPGTVVFYRSLFAMITIGILLLFQRKFVYRNLPWGLFLGFGIFNFFIPWISLSYGLKYLPVTVVIVIETLLFFLSVILIFVFKKVQHKKFRYTLIGSYAFVFFTLIFILLSFFALDGLGVLLIILGACSMVFALQVYNPFFQALSASIVIFGSLLWVTPIAFIFMMETSPGTSKYIFDVNVMIPLLFLGIISSGLIQICYRNILKVKGRTYDYIMRFFVVFIIFAISACLNDMKNILIYLIVLFFIGVGSMIFIKKEIV